MQTLRILRLRASCSCAARMVSNSMRKGEFQTPFLRPRLPKKGPDNPLLEISKPKALRDSFASGLLMDGNFDLRLLTYPEVLDEKRIQSIEQLQNDVRKFIDSVDPNSIKEELPSKVKEKLKSLGVFGALIPKEYGGQGLTFTEFSRIMEAFGGNLALASIVIAHNCAAAYSILRFGSERIKSEYLPKLASGEFIGAFAFAEVASGSDMENCQCRARQLIGEDHMQIQGEKIFITGGLYANLFLTATFVKHFSTDLAKDESRLSMVLIERGLPGVIVNRSSNLRGLHGNGLASVTFNNVKVENENLLGEPGDAANICRGLHSPLKASLAAAVLGASKTAYARALSDVNAKKNIGTPLSRDLDIQQKISETAEDIYAIESAIYMNAAIEDSVEKPETLIETSMIGLAGMDRAISLAEYLVKLYGSEAFDESHFTNSLQRDLSCLLWFYQTENLWRLLVAMTGVKLFGAMENQKIKILRDPLTHMNEWWKMLRKDMFFSEKNVKKNSRYVPLVHPSLREEAGELDFQQERLRDVFQRHLQSYGAEVFNYQVVLLRLTAMLCDVYLSTVALARVNRSVQQGSETADYELELFRGILKRSKTTLDTLDNADLYLEASTVQVEVDVFEKLIDDGRYAIEHPLQKNF